MKNKLKILFFLAIAVAFASCSEDDSNTKAGFTFSPEENIQAGDTVFFTNTSIDAVTYQWSFGDTETSTEENPFHIYTEPGIYDVTLVATNGGVANTVTQKVNVAVDFGYIINYGSYNGAKSTIAAYNRYDDIVVNGYYTEVNGVSMTSNVQYAYNYKGNIYFMNNNADGISWVNNKTFEQTNNAITTDINKPRFCIGYGDYLYVSCWESDAIFNGDLTVSYIAKVDLRSNNVVSKISLHGGPEGLEIVNDKLYAALTFKDSVAILNLTNESVSYIETPARTTNFEKDNEGNLYVTLTRDWDDYVTQTGIGYINTATDQLEAIYNLDGVGTSYDNVMEPNADFSKLYVMSSVYDANYNVSGSIAVFDVESKSFESENLVDGISAINGVDFYDNKVFCFISESVTGNGKAITYSEDGTKLKEYNTGIAPFMLLASE
ncbi:PKD domain-containing protein [Maribellus luteus]|uniref:PKD domain-containing protein n=1 Tax=Maribellus luteus TaxID=2305463 RepID=A0A399T1V8_9BACT|nr:PKD domain-containing protein [Maribellus luteus]RIJ47933.1 PKD domain-containing protein [Maribellus luteus]